MRLKIELEDGHFLDIDFDDIIYIVGMDQLKLWRVFRSFYYYFNKDPQLLENVYGENSIELLVDEQPISKKNNTVYFLNNRESIYHQMIYKKESLLFDLLNSLDSNLEVDYSIENINNQQLKLEIAVQKLLETYSNNLRIEFKNNTYLEFLKNNLLISYETKSASYPLELMDTEVLLDEFLNFLKFKLQDNGTPVWLILYNMDSFISKSAQFDFMKRIQNLVDQYDLKVVYLGNNLDSVPIGASDLEKVVIASKDFHQLLPNPELFNSVKMHYPNELLQTENQFVKSMKRIVPFVGKDNQVFISNKDLVLLKVINEILGYETSYDLNSQLISDAETKYLKD